MAPWIFRYFISDKDYLDFNEHFLLRTRDGRKVLLMYRLITPITFAIFILVRFFIDNDPIEMVSLVVMCIIAAVIMWFNAHKLLLAVVRHRLKNKNSLENSLFSHEGELIFDFENRLIIDRNPKEEVRVRFENIDVFYESPTSFYLFYAKSKAIILPFTAFANAQDVYAFQRILRDTFPSGGE